MSHPTHLDPSQLGTKSYWDTAYETELSNFSSNPEDEGTVWFSDAGAEERMLSFLEDLCDEDEQADAPLRKEDDDGEEGVEGKATRFLDLGTGNGHLLFALREDGWEGDMLGVDYSPASVALARSIAASKTSSAPAEGRQEEQDSDGDEEGEKNETSYADIAFQEWDILTQQPGPWLGAGFDVVLDKGTFDAICLSQETDAQGRRICEGYREAVEKLVKGKTGRFLITSCNWTAEELRGWFEVEGGGLVYEGAVRYPSFRFGGKEGAKVATLCFRRR